MSGLRHPALIKALRTGAFFIWVIVASVSSAFEGPVKAAAIDGDTIALPDGSHVRLVGINAPELGKDGAPDEPYAREAQSTLAQAIAHQDVKLELGEQKFDHYGRRLAHVLLRDGRDVATTLLAQGLAFAIAIPPNIARFSEYARIEAKARAAKLGIWSHSYYRPVNPNQMESRTGFRLVTGRVQHVNSTRYGYYLWLSDGFVLHVPRADVRYFPHGLLEQFEGHTIEARGWVTSHNGRLRIKIQHPGMLRMTDHARVAEKTYHSLSHEG